MLLFYNVQKINLTTKMGHFMSTTTTVTAKDTAPLFREHVRNLHGIFLI